MELNICHLLPLTFLNLYGDRVTYADDAILETHTGISVNMWTKCSIGQPLDVNKYDIFF